MMGGASMISDDLPPLTNDEKEKLTKFAPSSALVINKDDTEWRTTFETKYQQLHNQLLKEMQLVRELRANAKADSDLNNSASQQGGTKMRPYLRKLVATNQTL